MNKAELVESVASAAGLSKKDAGNAVQAVFDSITKSLSRKDPVAVGGFGTFRSEHRAARTGISPRTRQKIQVPAKQVAKFKPAQALKDAVNR